MRLIFKNRVLHCAFAPLRLFLFFLVISTTFSYSQFLPVHPQNKGIYSFLEEFPLETNPTIKPLSRLQISNALTSLDTTLLTTRQQKELAFYLKDYHKETHTNKTFARRTDLFYYRDSSFSITINPVVGGQAYVNQNGFEYHWWNGAEAIASHGNWGFYASLRDNHLSSTFYSPTYLDQQPAGSNFKVGADGKAEFEEIRGGVTYAWKTGHIGLVKDNFEWGTNYNGANIFSGHTPAFVHLDLQIKPVRWFEFNYIHGWLNSEITDSSKSFTYPGTSSNIFRSVYHSKFIAANMFSFHPVSKLSISLGNSIIYDYDQVHPAYLIPVMFFKAVDHNLTAGIQNMNSQMFLDISSKNIPFLHLYSTLFIDELAMDRILDKDTHNFASLKAGFRISNLIPGFFGGVEYTTTNALAFKHFVPTTSFESNRYNLGHYLTDNAKELHLSLAWKPIRTMIIELTYTDILKGPDHTSTDNIDRDKITPFTPIVFESQSLEINASWQIINDLYLNLGLIHRNVSGDSDYLMLYTPEFWWGETNSLTLGVNFGF